MTLVFFILSYLDSFFGIKTYRDCISVDDFYLKLVPLPPKKALVENIFLDCRISFYPYPGYFVPQKYIVVCFLFVVSVNRQFLDKVLRSASGLIESFREKLVAQLYLVEVCTLLYNSSSLTS